MQVTKNITLDLLETGSPVIIKAKQNDRNTRYIAAHLYVGRLDYQVPSGTEIAFRYKKPDGTAGFYDALQDNSPAITVSGNTVTVELVEQVLTVSGCVHCEINMYNATSEKLTTFTFEISVEESVLTDAEIISSDYYNVLTAEITKALQAVTDATEQAENAAQSAQDAADSAAMSKDWAAGQPVTYNGTPVSIAYAGAQRIASITAYGENAQGGTTEAPVALTGVDSVQVCGRNLLPMATSSQTLNGITCTSNSDGSVTIKGTATGWSTMVIDGDFSLPAGTYTLNSNTQTTGVGLSISKDVGGTQNIATSSTTSKTFTLPDLIKHYVAYIVVRPNSVVDTTIYPMLNLGSTAMPYEPYQGSVTTLPIPRPLRRVGDVKDKCVTRQDYESAEKLVVTYNVGFVELDGTEGVNLGNIDASASVQQFNIYNVLSSPNNSENAICSHFERANVSGGVNSGFQIYNTLLVFGMPRDILLEYGFVAGDSGTYIHAFKAYLAAQKAADTPVQVAYQLATPEVYATDPVDFDNAAGPLTVMTGGELEVRMTELVGTRSPELTGKMDKAVYTQVGNLNLGDNTNLLNPVNQQGQASYTGDSTSPYCIDRWRISNGTTYNIASRALTASSYANRACGMWQTNELAQQALAIGSTITFSGYINGMQHSGTIKILNRDLYSSFAEVPAGYECDDFEIVCCTASHEQSKYNLGIYPKKEAVLNWIKWEKGLYATPYAPKGFGLEQLECMRYYQTIKGIKYVLRKALASEGFPYVIPVTFMPMRAVPQTDITVTEGAENNLTATGVTQTACGIQFQPVAENVGLTFTLTLSANL